jgi:hypothetical protein
MSTSVGVSEFPFAGTFRPEAAVAANRSNTFVAALIASAEKRSRPQAGLNPKREGLARETLAKETRAKRTLVNETLETLVNETLANEALEALVNEALANEALRKEALAKEALAKEALLNRTPAKEALTHETVAAENFADSIPAEDIPAKTRMIPPPPKQTHGLLRVWSWLNRNYSMSKTKQLRVAETVSLGDKRFVAVVQVEGRKFLIGGGTAGVSLLTQLGTENDGDTALGTTTGSGRDRE